MKALTVKHPWAGAILLLGKDVENRTWKTLYRGRILIHSSKSNDSYAFFRSKFKELFSEQEFLKKLNYGCLLGSVELYGCVQNSDSKWAESGLWHWQLRDPILFDEPIVCKGSLSLWEYSGKLPDKV